MRVFTIGLLVTFLCTGCARLKEYHPATNQLATGAVSPDRRDTALQQLLDQAIDDYGLVGVQLSVRFPDGHLWDGASGTTDLERTHRMTPQKVIRLGSLTKLYMAVVVYRIVQQGLLSLDTPVNQLLAGCQWPAQVTVGSLLNHSSGIPDLLGPGIMLCSSLHPHKRWSSPELLQRICGSKLLFDPGTDHRYSNSNYILLGLIAEQVTGKPFAALLHREILAPLGLTHTYLLPEEGVPAELVPGFDRDLIPLPGWQVMQPDNCAWSSCAFTSGGMAASAAEVLRFVAAILDCRLVIADDFARMSAFSTARTPRDKYLEGFGYGLFRYGAFFDGCYGHQGLFIGSEGIALLDPEGRYAVVLLANVSRIRELGRLVHEVLTHVH